jgi:hypothetical protein
MSIRYDTPACNGVSLLTLVCAYIWLA